MRTLLVVGMIIGMTTSVGAEPLRVRAALCLNKTCTQRGQVGFGPVRVDVEVVVPRDTRNRRLQLGYVCDGEPTISEQSLDGQTDPVIVSRSYRIAAGECQGVAQVLRNDGTAVDGITGTLVIQAR